MGFIRRTPAPTPTEQAEVKAAAVAEPIKPTPVKGDWEVKDVPVQTASVLVNSKTGEQLDVLTALAKILNTLEEFKEEA